jgi:hypothetical protein
MFSLYNLVHVQSFIWRNWKIVHSATSLPVYVMLNVCHFAIYLYSLVSFLLTQFSILSFCCLDFTVTNARLSTIPLNQILVFACCCVLSFHRLRIACCRILDVSKYRATSKLLLTSSVSGGMCSCFLLIPMWN